MTTTDPVQSDASSPATARYRTVIEPARRWQLVDVGELWKYRELVASLAVRDVKVRYKQAVLGAAWAVLQPAMQMAVFTVFFGRLANMPTGELPQPLFFLTGVIPWMFFAAAVNASSVSVLSAGALVTKIYFPRLAVPIASVAAAAVDLAIACGLLLVVMLGYAVAGYDTMPGPSFLLLPLVIMILAVLATGLGTFLAAVNVKYRDFRFVVPFFIQLMMFATPTIYLQPTGKEGPWLQLLLTVNPLTSLVSGFRSAAVGGEIPWVGLAVATAVAAVVFLAACFYFRAVEDEFADII